MLTQSPESFRLARTLADSSRLALRSLGRLLAPAIVDVVEPRRSDDVPTDGAFVVRLDIERRAGSALLLVVRPADAAVLGTMLLGREVAHLDAETEGALAELANITASSFLTALSHAAGIRLIPTVPATRHMSHAELLSLGDELGPHAWEQHFTVQDANRRARGVLVATTDSDALALLKEQFDG